MGRALAVRALLFVIAIELPAAADDADLAAAKSMSLADIFAVAVRQAPALEHARLDAASASAAVDVAEGGEDIVVTMNGGYARTEGAAATSTVLATDSKTVSGTIGIRRTTPTNGTIELLGTLVKDTFEPAPAIPTPYSSSATLRLTQPLLGGFGLAAGRRAVYVARHQRDAATVRRVGIAREFAAQVVAAYWNLALAWRRLDISRAGFELARKQQKFTEGAVRTGKLAKSEQIPVDAALATREQDILASELDVLDRSIELRRLVGLEVDAGALALQTAALPEVDEDAFDLKWYVAQALETSAELAAAADDVRASRAAAAGSKRDLLPRVDLSVEAGPLGIGTTSGEAIDGVTSFSGYTVGANLTVEIPIGRNTVKGNHGIDRAALANRETTLLETRAQVAGDVARTVYAARAGQLGAALAKKAIDLAEANVEAEQRKFEVGKSTSNEIVRRQDELQQVRLRHAITVTDYLIARARLDVFAGTILDRYGMKIR